MIDIIDKILHAITFSNPDRRYFSHLNTTLQFQGNALKRTDAAVGDTPTEYPANNKEQGRIEFSKMNLLRSGIRNSVVIKRHKNMKKYKK